MLVSAMALSMTACGGTDAPVDATTTAPAETTTAAEVETKATEAETEVEAPDDTAAEEESGDFTLLDVTSDMVSVGAYAVDEESNEVVFTMFADPEGTEMASLFVFNADGSGDVICGTYAATTEKDENGIDSTVLEINDVYTGEVFTIIVVENETECVITNPAGTIYTASYLSAEDTITYMAAAVSLLSE